MQPGQTTLRLSGQARVSPVLSYAAGGREEGRQTSRGRRKGRREGARSSGGGRRLPCFWGEGNNSQQEGKFGCFSDFQPFSDQGYCILGRLGLEFGLVCVCAAGWGASSRSYHPLPSTFSYCPLAEDTVTGVSNPRTVLCSFLPSRYGYHMALFPVSHQPRIATVAGVITRV